MSRREFCQACSFARYGIKTRIAIEHTCDGSNIPVSPKRPYVPTREELDKYLAGLKELMELSSEPYVSLQDSDNAELQAKKLSNEDTSGQV